MTTWQIWLLIAAVFVVIEIFTSGFAVACVWRNLGSV